MTGYDNKRLDGRNNKKNSTVRTAVRGDKQNMTGYDNKRLDGRNNTKNSAVRTAVRIYEYTAAAVPVRTQGNGTPPGEL